MENEEATEARWKEVLEWCGFKHTPFEHLGTRKDKSVLHPQGITVISTQQEYWIYPDGSNHKMPPAIDLNNLFKWYRSHLVDKEVTSND